MIKVIKDVTRYFMTPDQFDELINDEIIRKRLAKWMARDRFRENTELESFHDRISEPEMKKLMIGVVDNCYPLPFDSLQCRTPSRTPRPFA